MHINISITRSGLKDPRYLTMQLSDYLAFMIDDMLVFVFPQLVVMMMTIKSHLITKLT